MSFRSQLIHLATFTAPLRTGTFLSDVVETALPVIVNVACRLEELTGPEQLVAGKEGGLISWRLFMEPVQPTPERYMGVTVKHNSAIILDNVEVERVAPKYDGTGLHHYEIDLVERDVG